MDFLLGSSLPPALSPAAPLTAIYTSHLLFLPCTSNIFPYPLPNSKVISTFPHYSSTLFPSTKVYIYGCCNKLLALKSMYFLRVSGGQKSESSITGLKSRCWQGRATSRSSSREFVSNLLQLPVASAFLGSWPYNFSFCLYSFPFFSECKSLSNSSS